MSDQACFRAALLGALGPGGPVPDDTQLQVMFAYYAGVLEANRRFNLTRIVDPAEAAVKHFADSLSVLGWVKTAGVAISSVLDVGSGAGFPAVPLAIMRPDWRVTALDSTAKKVRFVAELGARLGLGNLSAEHRRAGEWRPATRYDLATCKAVGALCQSVAQSRDLLRGGGHTVVYKTDAVSDEERRAGLYAAQRHCFDPPRPYRYRLRFGDETIERALWIFRKL